VPRAEFIVERLLEADDLDDVKDFLQRNSETMNEFVVSAISREEGDKWLMSVVPYGWQQLRNLLTMPYAVKHYVMTFRREDVADIFQQAQNTRLNQRRFRDFKIEAASAPEFR